MTDEIQIHTDRSGDPETDKQSTDEGTVWKERYLRLLADLENTKKRLTRLDMTEWRPHGV